MSRPDAEPLPPPTYTSTAAPGSVPAFPVPENHSYPHTHPAHGSSQSYADDPPTEPTPEHPPTYTFPTSFSIGGKETGRLLVDIPEIKGHLALLNALDALKTEVEGWEPSAEGGLARMPADKEKRWAWFVSLAVERFDMWCRSLPEPGYGGGKQRLEDNLPPLDVLMVWHSYMLNPRWYAEDAQRVPACIPLFALGIILGDNLALIPHILNSPPLMTDARVQMFEQRVGFPYDYRDSAKVMVNKEVSCPRCRARVLVPYMTPEGEGYLQQGFTHSCPTFNCAPLTKDALCARKLADNLSRIDLQTRLPGCLFGTTKDSESTIRHTSYSIMSQTLQKHSLKTANKDYKNGVNEELAGKVLESAGWTLAGMRARMGRHAILGRVMSAHATPMVYSVELVGAVLRQGTFVQKMADLQWTKEGFFDKEEDELALQHAIARYHAFMDLLSSSPASFFVPTLDIDLAWHTHQLMSKKYETDCKAFVGRYIDHDDKVDGITLSSAFDITCRAWKDRFSLDYTHCGCPLPGTTIGQRLSKFISSRSEPIAPPSQLVPPASRPDALAATHASEHNSVSFTSRNKSALRREKVRHGEHQMRMQRRIKRQQAAEKKRGDAEIRRREDARNGDPYWCGYGYPFLMPVPIYYGGGYGGCVGADHHVVDHGGACGNGSGMCGGGGCSAGDRKSVV